MRLPQPPQPPQPQVQVPVQGPGQQQQHAPLHLAGVNGEDLQAVPAPLLTGGGGGGGGGGGAGRRAFERPWLLRWHSLAFFLRIVDAVMCRRLLRLE